jgi:hypothetical protein
LCLLARSMFDESPLDWMVEPSLGERLEPAGRHPDVFATIPAEPPNRVAQVMGTKYLFCEQTGFDTFSPVPWYVGFALKNTNSEAPAAKMG